MKAAFVLISLQVLLLNADNLRKAIAILEGEVEVPDTNGTISTVFGTITFEETISSTLIHAEIFGLLQGNGTMQHGLHVHEFGIRSLSFDVSTRCNSAGSHYNPDGKTHGGLNTPVRHFGDFGNVESDNGGVIRQTLEANVLLLSGKNSIIGRALVLHARVDDLGLGTSSSSNTTGNSGARVACGTIGINAGESE